MIRGFFLGRRPYAPVHALMQTAFEARQRGELQDVVLLLEHEPVVTLGRTAQRENLLASPDVFERLGVSVVETGRGGDVTLHAPGQLVAYPIVDLSPDRRDVRKYVQGLTRVMASLVEPRGVSTGTLAGKIGLWVDAESPSAWPGEEAARTPVKLGAIGVRISRWVTQHGFALNLTTELPLFQLIVPCGIREFGVTSLERLTGARVSVEEAAERALPELGAQLQRPTTDLVDARSWPLDRVLSVAR